MDDNIQSLLRRYTWDIFLRKSVYDNNVLPDPWYFKGESKPDWAINKFKTQYFVRGDV